MLALYMVLFGATLIAGMAFEEYMPGTFGKQTKVVVEKEDE